MSRLASIGDSTTSKPPTVTFPEVGGMKPVTMRMVVDLPAPFGPRKPSTSPRSTVKETPSTARLAPNVLTRLSILIMLEGRNYRSTWEPENHAICRLVCRWPAVGTFSRARPCPGLPHEAGAHHRPVRPRRRLRFHRAFHGAAPVGLVRLAGDRREQA